MGKKGRSEFLPERALALLSRMVTIGCLKSNIKGIKKLSTTRRPSSAAQDPKAGSGVCGRYRATDGTYDDLLFSSLVNEISSRRGDVEDRDLVIFEILESGVSNRIPQLGFLGRFCALTGGRTKGVQVDGAASLRFSRASMISAYIRMSSSVGVRELADTGFLSLALSVALICRQIRQA